MSSPHPLQDKAEEIRFFSEHANSDEYDVFSPDSNRRLIDRCVELAQLTPGSTLLDLGCGSGVFTSLMRDRGIRATGLDISHALLRVGRQRSPDLGLMAGDIEFLPVASNSLDAVLLSGVVHHLPDLTACTREVQRVLRKGGFFVAFDPNRMNPFMWLYRDRSSPFYSSVGVTRNERPILAHRVRRAFCDVGFEVGTEYLSGLRYQYIASSRAQRLLPIYNWIESTLFAPRLVAPFRSFVLTYGSKS